MTFQNLAYKSTRMLRLHLCLYLHIEFYPLNLSTALTQSSCIGVEGI